MREEGVASVLINPNIATIQTDKRLADNVYFLPVTPEYVRKVVENERPDAILLGFGGQTALNCGVQLAKQGILEKYGVKVIGTPISGIEVTEDRELFKRAMTDTGIPVPESGPAYSMEEARDIANRIVYPVIIRVAYTLGGKGGGVARNEYELDGIVERGLATSLVHQVLVEEYVGDWKQIEYEVMRDMDGNSITVCNMENMLGMRVHTGDNIVVAPSQTLNNKEYHLLRTAAIRATEKCGVIGECNIQFALNPRSESYYTIEINARLSRSSALASKATGYPLAYIAAKLALGYTLAELLNNVTKTTTACFEPALDYAVVKIPRWDTAKFERASRLIGTQMKSVGEVMAVGRRFEEALQKAIRMLDIGKDGLTLNQDDHRELSPEEIENLLVHPTDEILFIIAKALKGGMPLERVAKLSEVDPWFLAKIEALVDLSEEIRVLGVKGLEDSHELLREAKALGFSDRQIARAVGAEELEIRALRKRRGVVPFIKQIDTLAAEWPAKTNYLYLTYNGMAHDLSFEPRKNVIVLGAGGYRIGSSVEFDWCTVNTVWGLKDNGVGEAVVINCNPETVSTDYDMSDRLYFEELTLERVLDIYEKEKPVGLVACVGGQVANNLAPKLASQDVKILGTSSEDIDRAEDRSKFSSLLDSLGIPQPQWSAFTSIDEAYKFADRVGYPVLVRPSYVLSGAAMKTVWTPEQLQKYLSRATEVSPEHPVVISKFIEGAMEVEVDAVSDGEDTHIGAIIEHVELAGVHSGDAIMVIPPQRLEDKVANTILDYTMKVSKALNAKGPLNIQFLVKDGRAFVIECNLRASRSMPFVSKFTGVNLMGKAAPAILGGRIDGAKDWRSSLRGDAVKVPQFSFMQLHGADPVLGVEMQSTGEVACFGEDFFDALSKAMVAAGYTIPKPNGKVLVTVGGLELKKRVLPLVRELEAMGYEIYATKHTADFLAVNGFKGVISLHKVSEPEQKPNITDYLSKDKLDLIVNIPSAASLKEDTAILEDEFMIRRRAIELGIPILTTLETADVFVRGLAWLRSHEPTLRVLA